MTQCLSFDDADGDPTDDDNNDDDRAPVSGIQVRQLRTDDDDDDGYVDDDDTLESLGQTNSSCGCWP